MLCVNNCCCCVDLELGGKIWGWLGVICGVFAVFKGSFGAIDAFALCEFFFILVKQKIIKNNVVQLSAFINGIFIVFGVMLSVASIIASWMLVKGVEEASRSIKLEKLR